MGNRNPSVPGHAQSARAAHTPHFRVNRPPRRRPTAHPSGVTHDNTRHTARFTVIGNHLAQHAELSLLAIGLAVHIQSLPAGARVDIKTLACRFPEGAARIAAALRELEAHGYLRRVRERTAAGRIVTRTISCNQPAGAARPRVPRAAAPAPGPAPVPVPAPRAEPPRAEATRAEATRVPEGRARAEGPRRELPAVPRPAYGSPKLVRAATDLLADLPRHDPRLVLSCRDTAHLAPGVAAWLEREVPPDAVRHALTAGLPAEGPRRPAALLAHRLAAQLPPLPPPFRAPAGTAARVRHPLQNCDGCDRAFRAPAPGRCGECRDSVTPPAGHLT